MKSKKKPSNERELLAAHLPFMSYFYLKNDLTIFKLIEKKFQRNEICAHVLNHPELMKTFSFNEVVYELDSNDVSVISLLIKGFNN